MLSEQEKKEMLEDGRSLSRRQQFAQARKAMAKLEREKQTLDEFIEFLMGIQRLFSPFVCSREKPTTFSNKL